MSDSQSEDATRMDDATISPRSTAMSGGNSDPDPSFTEPEPGQIGTTEADVTDGREQKLPRHD